MSLSTYVKIWIVLFAIFAFEAFALNRAPDLSLLHLLQTKLGLFPEMNLSPEPGRPYSLILGWAGIGSMLLTNIYILKKRGLFRNLGGSLAQSLNFHIFCGLVGPMFILFHCNFKVRGLVAISFWSMVVSFASGIVGRYFYAQLLRKKVAAEQEALAHEKKFDSWCTERKVSSESQVRAKRMALSFVGVTSETDIPGPFGAFAQSLVGDIRAFFDYPPTATGMPPISRQTLLDFAQARRQSLYLEPFQRIMGYWHAFHLPFAIFMYVAAFIHIVTALLFGVTVD